LERNKSILSEINAIVIKERYNKSSKSWFFEKINKIDKLLAIRSKSKRKLKLIKSEMQKEMLQEVSMKSRVA
jgi:hypothetical protein